MTMTKLKVVFVVLAALAVVGTASGILIHGLSAGQLAEPNNAGVVQPRRPAAEPPRKAAGKQPLGEERGAGGREAADDQSAADKARAEALDKALQKFEAAEQEYREFEQEFKKASDRSSLVQQEEQLRSLERQQAVAREREQEAWKTLHATGVKGNESDRERLHKYESETSKREEERTERLIDAKLKLAREEERLQEFEREWTFRRELTQSRVRSAAERLRRLEDEVSPPAAPARTLRDIERKLEELLREVGELRRSSDRR
jgi:hypothetical protein